MKSKRLIKTSCALAFAAVVAVPALASAGAVITSGKIALGVNEEGDLNTRDPNGAVVTSNASGYVGIAYKFADGTWRDATAPGCLCEGWGVSANNSVSGYANVAGGTANLSKDSFIATASSITSAVHVTTAPGIQVTQNYAVAAKAPGALFEDKVKITNTTGSTLNNVKYVRVMDWDVPPTEFNEFVTVKGTATTTLLEASHDNGFQTSDPLADFTTTKADFVDSGPADHGAYFRFNFGDLADGESREFSIFYGAADSENAMLAALGDVGVELYSLGQSAGDPEGGTPATYAFGFKGVGGEIVLPPSTVPEPGSMLLVGSGLAGLAVWTRRRKSNS